MTLRAVLALLFLPLALAVPVWATDFYVDKDSLGGTCNNGNAGTLTSPLCTVQAGVNRLGAGDTLYIRAGTYLVNINLAGLAGTDTNHVIISAYGSERPVLMACLCGEGGGDPGDANNAVYIRGPAAYIDFYNLTFDGNERQGTVGFATVSGQQPHHIRYFNCDFRHSESEYTITHAHHIEFHGGALFDFGNPNGLRHGIYCGSECNDMLVDGVEFSQIDVGYCIHVFADDVNFPPVSNTIIRNSVFRDCGRVEFQSAIVLTGVNQADVYNNVIWGSGGGGIYACHGGSGFGAANNVRVYHNTITANMVGTGVPNGFYGVFFRCGSGHVVRNNILYDNAGRDYGTDGGASVTADHNFTNNPLFANPATHNYHLTSTSTARGFGVFLGAPYNLDSEGNPFPNPPDAGAYAFGTTFSPVKGTYYVATTGSDGTTCDAARNTIGAPLATVSKALSCAAGESTIYLRQGTYTQSIQTSVTPIPAGSSFSAPTTIASYPGETATLQPTSAGAIVGLDNASTDQYLVFDRLVLDGVNASGSYGLQVNAGAAHIRFQQGEIKRVANNAVYLGGATTEILTSFLHDNTAAGALVAIPGANNVVRGTTIANGVSAGVFLFGSANGNLLEANTIRNNLFRGLRAQGGSNNKAFNNLIYSNSGDGLVIEAGETGILLYHNTVWNNGAFGLNILSGASSTAYTNNIFYQNGTDTPANGGSGTINTTNVSGNPSFISPGPPGTFHVEGANVVHTGTTLTAVTTDFAGKGRSATPGYTIGAYQDDVVGGGEPPGPQLAFPTAEGFGRFAQGGRGGRAYNINSLSGGSGSGGSCNVGACSGGTITFKDCLFDRFGVGARTCIFRVGGIIDMTGHFGGAVPAYLTIAGQTAPGDGIMLRGVTLDIWSGPTNGLGGHDVIIRHLRVRPGKTVAEPAGAGALKAFGGRPGNPDNTGESVYNIIFDHYSVGWAPDDTTGTIEAYNITYQWGILSEGIGFCSGDPEIGCDESKCMFYGYTSDPANSTISILHNLWANYAYRCPDLGAGKAQMINNVFYNLNEGSQVFPDSKYGGPVWADFVGNYYQTGPAYNPGGAHLNRINLLGCGARGVLTNCTNDVLSLVYLSGNYHDQLRPDNTYPEASLTYQEGDVNIPITTTRQLPPIASEVSAAAALQPVLDRAGAYAVTGGGIYPTRRDSIDARAITDFHDRTGFFDTCENYGVGPCEDAFGGYPTYNNGTPYPDTDGDGMANAWETAHGLDPNDPADGPAIASNGYSNLENFINELAGDPVSLGPPPGVSLTATPSTISSGGSSTLEWTGTSVTSCSAPWTASTATSGSQSVSPTATTTYTITCTDGTTPVTDDATVLVSGTPGVSLTAAPSTIFVGDSATLSWTSTDVTSCSAPWTASTATSGSQSVAPTTTTTYTITCTNGTTPVTSNATVTVTPRPGPNIRGLPYATSGFFVMP